ncbi:MAG: alpha/beta hydrolase domain-containing protein, partial [Pseudomonadales bacterium]
FLEGSARAYAPVGDWSVDGVWPIREVSTADYKTRILVRRPSAASQFSGVVIVEWFNVSSGVDLDPDFGFLSTEILREGHAWVGVTAQATAIESVGNGPFGPNAVGLLLWDPIRYASLQHPGDAYSYDIFSQVAATLRAPVDIDPLGGLRPQIILADGESQSAFRLLTYVNAIHPEAGVYDGFLVHSRSGTGASLGDGFGGVPAPARVRIDLDTPVFQFITETDLFGLGGGELAFPGARQLDSDNVHTWEVTGTAHADAHYLASLAAQGNLQYDNFLDLSGVLSIVNTAPQHLAMNAALHSLVTWVKDGTPPASAPPIETTEDTIVRDANGNALGGLRLPHIEVPIAVLSGEGPIQLSGRTVPFDTATLDALYPDPTVYIDAVRSAAQAAVEAGYLLAEDAATIIAEAETNPPVD